MSAAINDTSAQAELHVQETVSENTIETTPRNGTIVLIGPTRNGKSTLGNLLVLGVDEDAEPAFTEGDGAESETRECSAATVTDEAGYKHVILDTPGFGDTNGQDHVLQLHLAESLAALSDAGYGVSLFVMAVRRNNGLGAEYKELITLYRRLLGKFFEDHLQIVFTGSSEGDIERMEKRAKKQVKTGPLDAMEKVRRETCELLGVGKDKVPLMFVDAVPGTEEDEKRAEDVRLALFEKARVAKAWVTTTFDRIPKVLSWVNEDKQEIARLEGKLEGSVLGVSMNEKRSTELLEKEKELRAELLESEQKEEATRTWIREYDSGTKEYEFFNRAMYAPSSKWWPWRNTRELPPIDLRHPASKVYISGDFFTKGGRFEILGDERKQVRLVLFSKLWWRSATRTVTITTSYRNKFKQDIDNHRADARFLEQKVQGLRKERGSLLLNIEQNQEERQSLLLDVAATTEKALKLGKLTLSFEEFRARCESERVIPGPLDLSAVL